MRYVKDNKKRFYKHVGQKRKTNEAVQSTVNIQGKS